MQGIWAEAERAFVVTKTALHACDLRKRVVVSMRGGGESTLLDFSDNPATKEIPLFGFGPFQSLAVDHQTDDKKAAPASRGGFVI